MDVVDRGVGGVYLVQRGRGGGGERGYALAVVTWCAAAMKRPARRRGAMRKRHRTIDTRILERHLPHRVAAYDLDTFRINGIVLPIIVALRSNR